MIESTRINLIIDMANEIYAKERNFIPGIGRTEFDAPVLPHMEGPSFEDCVERAKIIISALEDN